MKFGITRKLAILTAALMLMTCVSACSSNPGSPSNTPPNTKAAADTSAPVATDAATAAPTDAPVPAASPAAAVPSVDTPVLNDNPDGVNVGLPIAQDKITITVMRYKNPANMALNDMPMFQDLEAKTNVHVEWEDVPYESWADKLGLALASGDMPDVIFGGLVQDSDVLSNKSRFLVLNDLIDQYAPNIVEMFNRRPETKVQSTADDGKIYSLPLLYEIYASDTLQAASINQAWLDKLGLAMPTTTDEFENVLKAFKDDDPNGNGQADEIPFNFSGLDGWAGLEPFFGSFGIFPFIGTFPNDTPMNVRGGKVCFDAVDPRMKDAVNYFSRLYSEGLINQEVFTQDVNQYIAYLSSDPQVVGVNVGWTIKTGQPDNIASQLTTLLPLKGPNGDQQWYRAAPATVLRHYFLVSSQTKYPEAIVRWVNELYTENMGLQQLYGSFGQGIQRQPDGSITFLPPPDGTDAGTWSWTCALNSNSVGAIYKDYQSLLVPSAGQIEKDALNVSYAPYLPSEYYPKIFFSKDFVDTNTPLITDIMSYVKQTVSDWIMHGGVDAGWDAYVAKLNNMGLQDVIGQYQTAYDAYMAAQ